MENCLVTKLKGVVDNNELIPMGALRLHFKQNQFNNAKSQYFTCQGSNQSLTVKLVGDGYLTTDINVPTTQKELTIPANNESQLFVSNTDCYVDIFPAYALYQFYVGLSGNGEGLVKEIVNKDIIRYLGNLSYIYTTECNACSIKLEWLSCPQLHVVNASYNTISGDLSALEGKSIGEFICNYNDGLTGSLDSLLSVTPIGSKTINLADTPNVYKKRSTITALQNAGWTITVSPEEVDENN